MNPTPIPNLIDRINQGTMGSAPAVETYRNYVEITPAERAVFDRVRDLARGRPILDLGVGAGRTVAALREISPDYVGLDYSPAMVDACRRRFPDVRFELGDARAMTAFRDGQFQLAVFSCNGLCMVGHEDRLRILREVHRVLADDGVFVFSTHNQRSADHDAGLVLRELVPTAHPLKMARRLARFTTSSARRAWNHWRLSRHDLRGPEYSIINDRSHDYGTMLYYISLASQRRQLEAAGFRPGAEAYDQSGRPVVDDTTDVSIAFVARK